MKTLKYSKTYLTSIFFILIIFIFLFFVSITEAVDGYRINPGQTITIDRHGECRKVTNPAGRPAIFVPVRTAAEWSAFRIHRPGHIVLDTCLTIILNSATGRSCSALCGDLGLTCNDVGVDHAATDNCAWGSPGVPKIIPPSCLLRCDIDVNCLFMLPAHMLICDGVQTAWTRCRCE